VISNVDSNDTKAPRNAYGTFKRD